MALLNVTQELSRHQPLSGEFIGVVEDNEDPLKLYRCKIRVLEVFGSKISTKYLPWSSPARELNSGGGADLSGVRIPRKGTRVFVFFHQQDVYSPVYWAIPSTKKEEIAKAQDNYPNRAVWRDHDNNEILIDGTTQSAQGNQIRIDNNTGEVEISCQNGLHVFVAENGHLTIEGPAEAIMKFTDKLTLDCNVLITKDLHTQGEVTGEKSAAYDVNVSDAKGSMQEMRDIYNDHVHKEQGDGNDVSKTPQKMN